MEEENHQPGKVFFVENLIRVLDGMIEGCQIIDFDDVYLYANESVAKHGKTSRQSLIGKKMTEVYPGIENTAMYKQLVKCRTDQTPSRMENEFSFHDGTTGWFDLSIQPVTSGVLILSMDITSKKLDEAKMKRRLQNLLSLRKIDTAIAGSLDLNLTLAVALDQVLSQLGVDAASVLRLDPQALTLEYTQGLGFYGEGITRSSLNLNDGLPREAVLSKKRVSVPNFQEILPSLPRAELLKDEGFLAYHVCPILAKGSVIGVLEVFERKQREHDDEWFSFLETLAGQIAIGIDSLSLFENLQSANMDLVRSHDATIEGWSRALDLRDKETEGHTQRVTRVSLLLAKRMGFTEKELLRIKRGALLHDIGKMGVPDSILLKPDQLTSEEWAVMKKHPVLAYELLAPIPFLADALDIPRFHHERWDGSGYPDHLAGEKIPLAARLFAVVDVWDALRSDRPYRRGMTWEEAKRVILDAAGSHFDPQAVQHFMKLMEKGDQEYRKL